MMFHRNGIGLPGAVIATLVVLWGSTSDSFGQTPRTATADESLPRHAVRRLGSVRFLPKCSRVARLEYSHDGKYLASTGVSEYGAFSPGIQIWERATGNDATPAKLKGLDATGLAWSPQGYQFVTSHRPDTSSAGLNLWTVGVDEPKVFSDLKTAFSDVDWSPQGDRIAARSWADEIVVFTTNGTVVKKLPYPTSKQALIPTDVLDFTLDGKQLVVLSGSGVTILDLVSGKTVATSAAKNKLIFKVLVLPDGKSLAINIENRVAIYGIDGGDAPLRTFEAKAICDVPDRTQAASVAGC